MFLFKILKKIVNLCLFRRLCRNSQLKSVNNFSKLHNFVAPVIIRPASTWIDSNRSYLESAISQTCKILTFILMSFKST